MYICVYFNILDWWMLLITVSTTSSRKLTLRFCTAWTCWRSELRCSNTSLCPASPTLESVRAPAVSTLVESVDCKLTYVIYALVYERVYVLPANGNMCGLSLSLFCVSIYELHFVLQSLRRIATIVSGRREACNASTAAAGSLPFSASYVT